MRIGFLSFVLLAVATQALGMESTQRIVGALIGRVIDAETDEPLSWTSVLLTELNRSTIAHEDGGFYFYNVPPGTYSIKTLRLGYQSVVQTATVVRNDTAFVIIRMKSTPFVTETVLVLGEQDQESFSLIKPTEVVAGRRLHRQLGRTLAETIAHEPSIAQRTMGPAPARPVLRGLGGDRLLILEDGGRIGDLSGSSPDHAVVIDPMISERIEIIRGPGGLVYGPNVLGGVINVVRGQIPSFQSHHIHGSLSLQGESVTRGLAGGVLLSAPVGPLVVRVDGSGRTANDIETPSGTLQNTSIASINSSTGASLFLPWGHVGAAGSFFESEYGIPGGFVGAHPEGVTVKMRRAHIEGKGEVVPQSGVIRRMESQLSFSRYRHVELEADGSLGVRYGLITTNGSLLAHHGEWGILRRGLAGVSGEHRDFTASGFVFTTPTHEFGFAAFWSGEFVSEALTVQTAIRGDYRRVIPDREKLSPRIGIIRERSFAGLSWGLAAILDIGGGLFGTLSVMQSFRAPGIEELFSEGPHLAAYSFEIGNPGLAAEQGRGLELSLSHVGDQGRVQISSFVNSFTDYIFPQNTGRINPRTLLPEYQYRGHDARMIGAEGKIEWRVFSRLVFGTSMSYVRGSLTEFRSPLPMIPPFGWKVESRYTAGMWTLGSSVSGAARQESVDRFEEPTPGYARLDFFIQCQLAGGRVFHTIVLNGENMLDAEYRLHLSRVKSIMPEPGRNVKLLYRLFF